MKNRILTPVAFVHLVCLIAFVGCTSFHVAGHLKQGRLQLMDGDPKVALYHFQNIAELRPDYVLNYSIPQLDQSIWTYVGRAYYATGRFPEARQALERARSHNANDQLAKIYLGLVLGRAGDSERGLTELEDGLRGLDSWLEYIEHNVREGHFWDPRRSIRTEIDRDMELIASGKPDWETLTASAEWIGLSIERRIDGVRKAIYRDATRGFDDE
jgi:tetratricopeptide (TPR) repeat protein